MKILVYRIGQLGDALVSAPAMWLLRQNFSTAQLDLLTNQPDTADAVTTAKVFDGTGLFTSMYLYPRSGNLLSVLKLLRLFLQLRSERYDTLAYLAPGARTPWQVRRDRIFFRLAGIKTFWGASATDHSYKHKKPLPFRMRESELLVERLTSSGLTPPKDYLRYDLNLSNSERQKIFDSHLAGLSLQGKKLIAVCPFSRIPSKRWPLERYGSVLKKLMQKHDCWPLFIGGKENKLEADGIVAGLGFGTNLAGDLRVRETASLLSYCLLYLGNDTGAMHLAASVGIPCVAIFSARTSPGAWYPAGDNNRILRLSVDCEGCEIYRCDAERMRCLTGIQEQDVLRQLDELMTSLNLQAVP